MSKKRPRFENPLVHNAILKSNVPPNGMSFTQRRVNNLCNIFRLLKDKDPDWIGGKIERSLVPRISYLAAQDFDRFNLFDAVELKFVVDFMEGIDEKTLPLDIFDTYKSDHSLEEEERTCTRAYISFYWWPSQEQAQQQQELALMCEHVNSLAELKDVIDSEDILFGLDLDAQYEWETFESEAVWLHVNEQLGQGAKKIKIIMWITQEGE